MVYDFYVGDRVVCIDNNGNYPEGQECTITHIRREHTRDGQPLSAWDFLYVLMDDGGTCGGFYVRRFRLAESSVDSSELPDVAELFS